MSARPTLTAAQSGAAYCVLCTVEGVHGLRLVPAAPLRRYGTWKSAVGLATISKLPRHKVRRRCCGARCEGCISRRARPL